MVACWQPGSGTEKTNRQLQYVVSHAVDPPPPPWCQPLTPSTPLIPLMFDFNNLCPAAACKGKNFATHPCTSSPTAARRHWQRRAGAVKWSFHFSGGKRTPYLLATATSFWPVAPLWTAKGAFLFHRSCTGGRDELPSPTGTKRLSLGYLAEPHDTSSDGTRQCVPIPVCASRVGPHSEAPISCRQALRCASTVKSRLCPGRITL